MPLLFPGVGEMLRDLAAEGSCWRSRPARAAAGSTTPSIRPACAPLFHATRTVDEAFSKPHPKMLLDILDEMGVAPREAVMIGDTTYDLEMARSARTPAVGVCSGRARPRGAPGA